MAQSEMDARQGALALVSGVLDRGRSLAEQGDAPLRDLPGPERARAQALALATLRHLGRIDALLAPFLERMPPAPARHVLRLGVADLHVLGTAPHAAVDGAVRLARDACRAPRQAGLVNAVLRRAVEPGLWEAAPEAPLPAWIATPVRKAFGRAALAPLAAAHARDSVPLDLTLKPGEDAAAWAALLEAEILPTGSLRRARPGQVTALPGYAEGAWWVQDAAAALPARLLGPVAGARVLDLCAAPGGKTLQLAAAGAAVTALDLSEPRLARLRANLARTGLHADVVAADALAWTPPAPFDAILLDAPCSATGTLRRHPDLPFLRDGDALPALMELQAALLARAWDWLAPGGHLVYCTCSLLPAEGEIRIARFLEATPSARLVAPAAQGLDPAWITGTQLRLRPDFWPERGGMDGFFAACLARD